MKNENVKVSERHVSCEGDNGPLGHPRIYLHIAKEDQIDCPYCGKTFIYDYLLPYNKNNQDEDRKNK